MKAEEKNTIRRSELWHNVYKILERLPIDYNTKGDCLDIQSASCEIEKTAEAYAKQSNLVSVEDVALPPFLYKDRAGAIFVGGIEDSQVTDEWYDFLKKILPKQSNWVSVEDRLPDEGDIVFVWAKHVEGEIHYSVDCPSIVMVSFDRTDHSPVTDTDFYEVVARGITHWQPLPEPPKQEDFNCPSCGEQWNTQKANSCQCGASIKKQ